MIEPMDKWQALVKFDVEIAAAAEKLRPYGEKWIDDLGRAFFALDQDRKYLPSMVNKLLLEAEQEKANRWKDTFRQLNSGELCNELSFRILSKAEAAGYILTAESDKTIVARFGETSKTHIRSNSDIRLFGKQLKFVPAEGAEEIARRLLKTEFIEDALFLIQAIGGEITKERARAKLLAQVLVLHLEGQRREFNNEYEMTQWVIKEVAPVVITKTKF